MKQFLSVIVLLAAAASPAASQLLCGPDGFGPSGGCCTPGAATIPALPALTVASLGACVRDCNVESQFPVTVVLAPTQVLCDYWLSNLVVAGPGFTATTNLLVMKYARTWIEIPAPGTQLQIFRFLVNADLVYNVTTAAIGCPVPLSAVPPFNLPVNFMGHVDYAHDCSTGTWQVAFALSHFCGPEMHASFSQRPIPAAAGWPKRTYHFVGPANFTFGVCPPPDGLILADSTRNSQGMSQPVPYGCRHEAVVVQGMLGNVSNNCVCFDPPAVPVARYTHQNLNATETCGAAVAPIINFAGFGVPFMPTGLRALSIGNYNAAPGVTYPGAGQCISVYLGVIEGPSACPSNGPLNAVTGVGTNGGLLKSMIDSPAPPANNYDMLDLQNILVITATGFQSGFGSLFGSERVWSFSML